MKLVNTNILALKSRMLLLVMFAGSLFYGCEENDLVKPVNQATIRFGESAYTIERNSPDALVVTLPLSLPLEEDATATIKVSSESTAESSDYTINPSVPSEGLTLNLSKGATEVSIQISSSDEFEGDRELILDISSATGGLTVANTNARTIVSIKGKPIVLPEIIRSVATMPDFGNVITGTASAEQVYTVSGIKLTSDITILASDYFELSLDNLVYSGTVTVPFAAANAGPVNVYVKFLPASGENKNITGIISHSSGTVPGVTVNVSGTEYGNALPGVLLLNENFSYGGTAGNLKDLSGGNWDSFSGTVNPVQYQTSNLSFANYGSSGVGGSVISENGSGSRQDLYRSFPTQTSGTVYISQLINVASAPSGNDFCTSMRDGSSYINRIYFHDNGGKLNIGIAKSSATIAYSETDYNYGTTYLLVSKYDFNTGVSSIYVLSSGLTAIEPPVPAASSSAGTGPSSLENFIIRQNTTSPLTITFDGFRVATSWKEAVGL